MGSVTREESTTRSQETMTEHSEGPVSIRELGLEQFGGRSLASLSRLSQEKDML